MLRKLERAKAAKRENKAAARESAAALKGRPQNDAEENAEADEAELELEEELDLEPQAATGGFSFQPVDTGSGFSFSFPSSLGQPGGAKEAAKSGGVSEVATSKGKATPAEAPKDVSATKAQGAALPSCLPFTSVAEVDATLASVWDALLSAASAEHLLAAERAFDSLCDGLDEQRADQMTDAVAGAPSDAAQTLLMLREVLCWRAPVLAALAAGSPPEGEPAPESLRSAGEAAAKVVHQLLTISRSWGKLTSWSAGQKKGM